VGNAVTHTLSSQEGTGLCGTHPIYQALSTKILAGVLSQALLEMSRALELLYYYRLIPHQGDEWRYGALNGTPSPYQL